MSQTRKYKFTLIFVAFFIIATSGQLLATPILGGQLYSTGNEITIEVLSSSAGFTSKLYLYSPANEYIAINTEVGTTVNIGPYTSGTELIFSLFVTDTEETFYTGLAERNPDRLAHAMVDFDSSTGIALVGFEDVFNGGDFDYNDCRFKFSGGITDSSYTDEQFGFYSFPQEDVQYSGFKQTGGVVVPEPTTILLLGGGLAGLAFYRRKKK